MTKRALCQSTFDTIYRGLTLLLALAGAASLGSGFAAEVELATDAPRPLPPDESLRRFQLPAGFHMELVASEPLVADPVAMAFDARGRIFVCEIHGYNLEGYLDVLQQNKTGVLDKAVRRIPANPEAEQAAAQEQYGTVKLLEDTDGDGRMDRATVWADRLPPCYGVVPARDGVIVLCAPEIIYLADRDGDGQAEVRQTLFNGFGTYDLWSRISNPRWGLDNWIYAANGINSGGTIQGPGLPQPVRLPATCFRFRSDGSALEPASGSSGGYGLAFNDWGDRFLVTNQQHALFVAPLPHRYLARNPYYAAPNPVINISSYGMPAKVFPTSQPDPWRVARGRDPAWLKFYGAAEATPNGFFTAASGQMIYQAEQFPPPYHGNHFSVDNAQNMVHRCLLLPEGFGYTVQRAPGEEQVEFLTSTEQWFRPVNLMNGPDGSMYVVDMYRCIIEDYSAIPRYLQQLYIESLIAGADKGRIWRLVADGAPQSRPFDLTKGAGKDLVAELANRNVWWRETAQRLLVERADKSVVPLLSALVRTGPTPQSRLHALYALEGIGELQPELVAAALSDGHFAVRLHSLRLAERWLSPTATTSPTTNLLPQILTLVDDPEPRVRLQVALTLGESREPHAVEALQRLAARDGHERWMAAAILSSAVASAEPLLEALLRPDATPGHASSLVQPLASIVGARHENEELGRLLAALGKIQDGQHTALQITCLKGLEEGLKRGQAQVLTVRSGQAGLTQLLVHPSPQVQELALHVAGLVKLQESVEMRAALASASQVARDDARTLDDRLTAVALLSGAPYGELAPLVQELLDARQPLELQLAAVRVAASVDDPRIASVLLAHWSSLGPKVQVAVMDAIFTRQNRLPVLLDALEKGALPSSSLDAMQRVHLLENSVATVRQRAQALLPAAGVRQDREAVLARYTAALATPRDAERGKVAFEKLCSKCHVAQGKGSVVGPDLSVTNRKSDEMLLADVLDPSNQITVGYNSYTVITQNGHVFSGILAAETATSVTLRRELAAEDTILRKDIEVLQALTTSQMPENLEKEVSPQELADLITYLRAAFGPAASSVVMLFEDEAAFATVLNEGAGTARLETADHFSGVAALAITPPQRWNLNIPGWQYRITEKPGPGEFRYLRWAWKSQGGQGVMIELAGGGRWPPAEKPLWRYYSGANTTGWAAMQLSPEAPREWTVMTRDLWKDFGSFTLTGIAPTASGGVGLFDRIELLRSLDSVQPGQ